MVFIYYVFSICTVFFVLKIQHRPWFVAKPFMQLDCIEVDFLSLNILQHSLSSDSTVWDGCSTTVSPRPLSLKAAVKAVASPKPTVDKGKNSRSQMSFSRYQQQSKTKEWRRLTRETSTKLDSTSEIQDCQKDDWEEKSYGSFPNHCEKVMDVVSKQSFSELIKQSLQCPNHLPGSFQRPTSPKQPLMTHRVQRQSTNATAGQQRFWNGCSTNLGAKRWFKNCWIGDGMLQHVSAALVLLKR